MSILKNFLKDESGLESVEYAVLCAAIIAVVTTAAGALATDISTAFGAAL